MKLLKALINYQSRNIHDQVLGWLYWLKNYCSGSECFCCEFYNFKASFIHCEVRNACRDIIKYQIIPPSVWRLPQGHITPERPPKLDFLRNLHWDREGNPTPLSKGEENNEIIKGID